MRLEELDSHEFFWQSIATCRVSFTLRFATVIYELATKRPDIYFNMKRNPCVLTSEPDFLLQVHRGWTVLILTVYTTIRAVDTLIVFSRHHGSLFFLNPLLAMYMQGSESVLSRCQPTEPKL